MNSRAFLMAGLLAFGLASTLVAPVPALAQSAGSISGTVTDGAGQPLGNARITVSGPVTSSTTTKPDGTYTIAVPPGVYSVTIVASGFESSRNDSVVVAPGQSATLTTALANASLTTIGRVRASSTSVNTAAAASQTLTASAIQSQGQNQVVNVLDQIPGIEVFRTNGGSNEPGANSSISIRGAQPYESQVLLDGHPVDTSANGVDGFNTTFINSLLLSGVEVSKGSGNMPNTIENAVGGTVNFRTPSITAKPTGTLLAGIDSFGSFYYAAKFSDTFGKFGVLLGDARNTSPGYLRPQNIYGGDNFFYPSGAGIPFYPDPSVVFGKGTTYAGVLNFSYPATSNFDSDSQLVKLSYNFSPVTSVQFTNYSTQSYVDETGNNIGNVYAKIVPCITTGAAAAATCPAPGGAVNYDLNYTATPFLGLVGQTVPINYYAGYPTTSEFVNQPIYSGEFRTVIGPGSLLARYYAGSVSRTVTQIAYPSAISPCYTPACAWDPLGNPDGNDNGYPGEPYTEPFIDVLHGFDAQYTIPFGPNSVTLGFDRHVDAATFIEIYALGYPPDPVLADYYTLAPPDTTYFTTQSISESLRGTFQLMPKLQLEAAGYLSNTTFVGSRFDPRVGLTFKPNANASFRASWGSAFVAPYYSLIIPKAKVSSGSLQVPTTSFAPETSSGYDFGTDVKLGHDTLVSADYYATTIYNRYATIVLPISGTFNGRAYSSETINSSQGNSFNEGVEFQLLHSPKTGLGYHVALDLLRDYSYNQIAPAKSSQVLFYALPDNGVQLPGYPFSKIRGDLTYTFGDNSQLRFSSTTYGANNSFGQAGFTEFDAAVNVPIGGGFSFNLGATNLSNKDNGQVGGLYYGGYTYAALGGGTGPTNQDFVQPRTVFLQVQKTLQ